MDRYHKKIEKWEQKHYLASVLLYSDGDSIFTEKPLWKPDYGMSTSDKFWFYLITLIMYIIPSIGLFLFWIYLVADLSIDSYSFGEDLGFVIFLGIFMLVWWLVSYAILFRGTTIQAIYIENCTLHWIGIPMFGVREKQFDLNRGIIITKPSNIELALEFDGWSFGFMRKCYNTALELDEINAKLKEPC